MSRPALSASRALDIIELLATFPDREFTLSEVSRATSINSASCHAVLTVLADRGYLTRLESGKAYELGPSITAAGQAALKSQQMVMRGKKVAERLARDLDLPVMLCAAVGTEIVAVISVENSAGRDAGMFVGERLPLKAPIGVPFIAWSPEEDIAAWLARRQNSLGDSVVAELHKEIEITRTRGFQVSMRPEQATSIGALMADIASRRGGAHYKDEVSNYIESIASFRRQPATIVDKDNYEVQVLSAPIFDRSGRVVFNLTMGGFGPTLTGEELNSHADQLVQSCVDIMRADKYRSRIRG